MEKKLQVIIIFSLLILTVVNSGCINTQANSTWGEKKISLDALEISNNTTAGNYTYNGTDYYYLEGWIHNNNPVDVLDLEMVASFYAADGSVVATNNSFEIIPKNVPANGMSYFYVEIVEPANKIVNYNINITNARGEY